jgi:hypothetical protein
LRKVDQRLQDKVLLGFLIKRSACFDRTGKILLPSRSSKARRLQCRTRPGWRISHKEASMSNLKTARQTIEAELRHVEEGIAFYQAKAAALQAALEQINSAEGAPSRKTRQARQATPAVKKRGRKAGTKKQDKGLPRMTRDFWLDFISQQPKSAVEITNAAIDSFEPSLNQDQAKKMKQRATQALQALLSTKQIKDVGTGRQRRYFLPLGKSAGASKQAAKGKTTSATDASGTVLH